MSVELMRKAGALSASGFSVINLSAGEPDFDTPEAIKQKAIEALAANHTHYMVGRGNPKLRELIIGQFNNHFGMERCADQVIVTPGAKFALYLALCAILNPGDQVLVPTPSWLSYFPMVQCCGAHPIEVPLSPSNGYRLTVGQLESLMDSRVRVLLLNDPCNPTGRVLDAQERAEVATFSRRHPDVYIVLDEIYSQIVFSPLPQPRFPNCDELEKRLVVISGFSKSHAMTGWRLGHLIAPQAVSDAAYKLFTHTITGVSTFIQEAATVADAPSVRAELNQHLERYKNRRASMMQFLSSVPFLDALPSEGTFYIWVRLKRSDQTAKTFCAECLEQTGVMLFPGHAYGTGCEQYIRFSLALAEGKMAEAFGRLSACWLRGESYVR